MDALLLAGGLLVGGLIAWFVAYGLCLARRNSSNQASGHSGSFDKMFKGIKDFFSSLTKQLLP